MTDLITISEQIEKKIVEIDKVRAEIKSRGEEKAKTAAIYDMEVSKYLVGLENGKVYEIGGNTIVNPPKSIMEKLARGLAWEEKLQMDTAEVSYKSIITNLSAIQAQLSALQSIIKFME